MTTPTYKLIDIGGSPELQRRQINVNFALLQNLVGSGTSLPDPTTVMEGSYFTLSDPPTIEDVYQMRSGAWVNLNILFA